MKIPLLLAIIATTTLHADSLRLFNSGAGTRGAILPIGSIDPHVTIVDRTDGLTNISAYVVAAFGGWLAHDSNSRWLSASSNALQADNAQWTFRVPIDLHDYDPATARIQVRVAADNAIDWTRLNGQDLGYARSNSPFVGWQTPLTLTNGFRTGLNYLEFRVNDYGPPSGFRIELVSGSAVPCFAASPEVGWWRLESTGEILPVGRANAYFNHNLDSLAISLPGVHRHQPLQRNQHHCSRPIRSVPSGCDH